MKFIYKIFAFTSIILFFNFSHILAGNIIITQPIQIQQCEGTENQYFEIIPNVDLNFYDFYVQWYKENTKFVSTQKNNAKLLFPKLTYDLSGDYYAEVWTVTKNSNPNINLIDFEKSVKALLYVNSKTRITKQPKKDNYVVVGGNVSVSFEAHLVNNRFDSDTKNIINLIEIQWLKGNNAITESKRISGTKSSLLNINNLAIADFGNDYRVVVKSLCGVDTSDYFSIKRLYISGKHDRFYEHQCQGNYFKFKIIPYISDSSELKLQWYYDDKPLVDGSNVSGAQTDSLTIQLFDNKPIYLIVESVKHKIKVRNDTYNLILDYDFSHPNWQLVLSHWYVKKGANILEQPGPKEIILEDGEILDLFFKIDDIYNTLYPNMFKWYKDGDSISYSTSTRFYLHNVKPSDAGKYYCESINKCGSSFTDTINVIVNTSAIHSGIDDTKLASPSIFPNPSSDKISVDLGEVIGVGGVADLSIYDILGNEIMTIPNYYNKKEIDVSILSIGNYTIQIRTTTGSVSQRLLVNR